MRHVSPDFFIYPHKYFLTQKSHALYIVLHFPFPLPEKKPLQLNFLSLVFLWSAPETSLLGQGARGIQSTFPQMARASSRSYSLLAFAVFLRGEAKSGASMQNLRGLDSLWGWAPVQMIASCLLNVCWEGPLGLSFACFLSFFFPGGGAAGSCLFITCFVFLFWAFAYQPNCKVFISHFAMVNLK